MMSKEEVCAAIEDLRAENQRRFRANMAQAEVISDLRKRLEFIESLPLVQWAMSGGHPK